MVLTLKSPNQDGNSEPLIISTYQNKSLADSIVDQDSTNAIVAVANLWGEVSLDYKLSDPVARGTGSTDLTTRVRFFEDIDKTFKLTFRDLTLAGAATCQKKEISGSTVVYLNLPCTYAGNVLTISGFDTELVPAGTTGEILIKNVIQLPSVAKYAGLTQNLLGRHDRRGRQRREEEQRGPADPVHL